MFYHWHPITPRQNEDNDGTCSTDNGTTNDGSYDSEKNNASVSEEEIKKKFNYIPIVVLEELMNESSVKEGEEAEPNDTDEFEATSKCDNDEKPDMKDLQAGKEETSDNPLAELQDTEENNLELGAGTRSPDGDDESKSTLDKE